MPTGHRVADQHRRCRRRSGQHQRSVPRAEHHGRGLTHHAQPAARQLVGGRGPPTALGHWATILELVVQCSLDSGTHPVIAAEALNCKFPSNLNDSQISDSTKTLPTGHPTGTFTQSSIQHVLLRSLPIRLRIAELLGQYQGEIPYDTTLRLGAELTAACRENSNLIDSFFRHRQTATAHRSGRSRSRYRTS
ncbi:uncharacterized protein LY79DRAFT_680266 [Colletotrichum navitas]|uniref:Uncharacterized protein n=1 Tax=Colletotrichum navitas TaxID=681940 RepID=A0AAD8PL01_9PEZI|nr:uncharacterized protein LY79DRAFT_680266 [Colletotrichum navitas]KAK1569425.1 hypothetical protein LY79DRAFT_680266 [Colletotrichum navitas]